MFYKVAKLAISNQYELAQTTYFKQDYGSLMLDLKRLKELMEKYQMNEYNIERANFYSLYLRAIQMRNGDAYYSSELVEYAEDALRIFDVIIKKF